MGLFLAPAEGFELQPRHFFQVVTEMEVTVIVIVIVLIAPKFSEQPGRGKTPRNTVRLSLGAGLFDYPSYSVKQKLIFLLSRVKYLETDIIQVY